MSGTSFTYRAELIQTLSARVLVPQIFPAAVSPNFTFRRAVLPGRAGFRPRKIPPPMRLPCNPLRRPVLARLLWFRG